MNENYPHLFSPLRIGGVTLKNRIVSAPTSQADINADGTLHERNIDYFARKARGGAAVVTVGDGIIHPSGKDHPTQLLLYRDESLPSLVRCAEAIHRGGALACCELSHGGIVCDPKFLGGERPFGPSEMEVRIGFTDGEPVFTRTRELTAAQMEELTEAYAAAAARVKRAGFDMVMAHAAHGWLIGQFFSPDINRRQDEYGGSIENRCRFARLVLTRIRAAVGPGFPITLRINGCDETETGLRIADTVAICRELEPFVDAFHVSAGVMYAPETLDRMHAPMFAPRGHLLDYAAAVRAAVNVPVISVGGHGAPDDLERALAAGRTDAFALGRQLLADPDFAEKARRGQAERIRPCQRCGTCQSCRFALGTARCAVNPEIGHEALYAGLGRAPEIKRVLVVGGGPGGMRAAIAAARRGHRVTLYEKEAALGGLLRHSAAVPFKRDIVRLLNALAAEMAALGVETVLNCELTPEQAAAEHPDAIIAALGAVEARPEIPGAALALTALEAEQRGVEGETAVVVGGGLVGCETAIWLAGQGKAITLLQRGDTLARDANFRHGKSVRRELERLGVDVRLGTACSAVTPEGALARCGGEERLFRADAVVLAAGLRPLREVAERFRDAADVFLPIGCCVAPGQLREVFAAADSAGCFCI